MLWSFFFFSSFVVILGALAARAGMCSYVYSFFRVIIAKQEKMRKSDLYLYCQLLCWAVGYAALQLVQELPHL